MSEKTRRLLALLRLIERRPPPYADQVDGDDTILDAWFGQRSPSYRRPAQAGRRYDGVSAEGMSYRRIDVDS